MKAEDVLIDQVDKAKAAPAMGFIRVENAMFVDGWSGGRSNHITVVEGVCHWWRFERGVARCQIKSTALIPYRD